MSTSPAALQTKPRVIILALLYSNDIDIRGLVATTSTWQRSAVHPEEIERPVLAYRQVLPNLRVHSPSYPDSPALLSVVRAGRAANGLSGVGPGLDTDASRLIIDEVDKADTRPVWICIWGGAIDLAQALDHVQRTRTPREVEAFVAKRRRTGL